MSRPAKLLSHLLCSVFLRDASREIETQMDTKALPMSIALLVFSGLETFPSISSEEPVGIFLRIGASWMGKGYL